MSSIVSPPTHANSFVIGTTSQIGGVEDQPQCGGLWHGSSPSARSLSRSPSTPPSFTQSPSPPRSLVDIREGQTSPHSPWLVVYRSTCRPLSPSPHANSFIIGTVVTNTHTLGIALSTLTPPLLVDGYADLPLTLLGAPVSIGEASDGLMAWA
jgi:hypothetical protein